jgi:CubicO group peptidase (beta-lactamase class C family)
VELKELKKSLYLLPLILLFELFQLGQALAGYFPGKIWRNVNDPQEAGWSSKKLKLVKQYADKMDSVGGMILYDGKILCKWGNIEKRGQVHSVRKSLLSSLYGIYHSEGKIDLNYTLGQLGIDDKEPRLSHREKQARIIDLLQARSGVYHPAAAEPASMKRNRPKRGSHAPGTFWFYNNWDFNTLGVIFEELTRKKIGAAFKDRIANPTGMQDFRIQDVSYSYCRHSFIPAYPFSLSARDMARFGLLYMRNGRWVDRQVIPGAWVADSTASYSRAWTGGYGYMWWVAQGRLGGVLANKINSPAYSAQGSGGQFIVVLPSKKLVIVNLANFDKSGIRSEKPFGGLMKLILADNAD